MTQNPTEDYDYDVLLFWPSLSGRDVSSGPGDALYGPVSINSESEYDSVGLSSGRSSPIIFAPTLGCRSRSRFPELDLGLTTSDSPQVGAEAEAPKEGRTKYSRLFKLGFYLSQMSHLVDRAIDGVKIKVRKPRSQAQ